MYDFRYGQGEKINIKLQMKREIATAGGTPVKATSFQILPVIATTGHIMVFWFSRRADLFPDNDAPMNVISCCVQIIAGLYGITLAGYTFFRPWQFLCFFPRKFPDPPLLRQHFLLPPVMM